MRDRELYGKILGIKEPWLVVDVELRLEEGEVRVFLERGAASELLCPECEEPGQGYDKRSKRWRHLDTCQYRTVLVAEVPRVECSEHGVRQIRVPWSEPGSRFTALFEALAIDWLQESSTAAVARLLGLSWNAADGILQRAVQRGLARREPKLPAHVGVDETSFQKRHEYVTVLSDQDEHTVVHVADGRGREALDVFWETFSEDQRADVESVAMDMWPAYIASIEAAIPDAERKIAFDKFHVAAHLGQAVDRVRRGEHRSLLVEGEDTLKGRKYLWLQNPDAMSHERWADLKALRDTTLKTARAWAIKEFAMSLWQYSTRGWARKASLRWYSWAIRSQLEPIHRVARMVKRHLEGILNAIVLGVTNARSEAINAKIQWIKYTARGFRNRDRFRNAIYFHLGGLSLYPDSLATHTD